MKILPVPPTDNLYKFMAIFGLWLSMGLLIFFLCLGYFQYQIDKESLRISSLQFSESIARKIGARIKSIEENRLDDNRLAWIPKSLGKKEEIIFIKKALVNHNIVIKNLKKTDKDKYGNFINILEYLHIRWLIVGYVFITIALTYFGFKRWYIRVQAPFEAAKKIELEIKRQELAQLKRAKRFMVTTRPCG